MNHLPAMFIGSSTEGLKVARALQAELQYDVDATLWSQGVFGLSESTLETLMRKLKDSEFAVLVLTPDDVVVKRGMEGLAARDNVLFEAGLFMGALGRDRTYIVAPRDAGLDRPTDLAGVTIATYSERRDGNMRAALGPAADDIREALTRAVAAASRSRRRASQGVDPPGWGELYDAVLYVGDWDSYVQNARHARREIRDAIARHAVIPSRYHYSSDVLADRWVDRCRDLSSYQHQRNTLNFWRSDEGRAFAATVSDSVAHKAFDFVSLGPGDGEKDAILLQNWLREGAELIYYPYDASHPLIVRALQRVTTALGKDAGVPVRAVLADFWDLEKIRAVFADRNAPNVIGLLGTLGNLNSELRLLGTLRDTMSAEDLLLLEVRLQSEMRPNELAPRSSLQQDFGPLEEYFGLTFSEASVSATELNDLSDVPNTRTMLSTYKGELDDLGTCEVKLQYIHLYDPESFLKWVDGAGFEVVREYVSSTRVKPAFLECLLRRR